MTLFDWLNQITYNKQPWDTFTAEDKAEFNTYMIHRFISMNSDYIDIFNLIQRYPDCPKRKVYQFYCDLLPKQKAFFKYIFNIVYIYYTNIFFCLTSTTLIILSYCFNCFWIILSSCFNIFKECFLFR